MGVRVNLHTLAAVYVITTIGYTSTALPSATGQPIDPHKQLMQGCSRNNIEQVRAALAAGADVNLVCNNNDEDTALTLAAKSSCTLIVKALLHKGAAVNRTHSIYGTTALYWALEQENELVAQILVEHGAHLPIEHQGELYFRLSMFPLPLSAAAKKFLYDKTHLTIRRAIYESLQQNNLSTDLIRLILNIADLSPPYKFHPDIPSWLDLASILSVSPQLASKLLPTGS